MMADTESSTPTCQFCGANLIFHGQTSCQACGKDLSGRPQSAGPAGSIWGASSPDSASSVANPEERAGATAEQAAGASLPASAAEGSGAMGFAVTPAPGQQRSTTWSSTTTSSMPGPEGGPSREHPHGQSRSRAAVLTERPESPPAEPPPAWPAPAPAPRPGDPGWTPNQLWAQDSRRQSNARRTPNSGAGCMVFAGIALAILGLVGLVGLGRA